MFARNAAAPSALARLAGKRVLVLNWRDVRHPQAGGAEQYMHQIARRWVAAGAHVMWCTARPRGQQAVEVIDGIRVVRSGGELSLYLRAAARMVRTRADVDVVVDCQNGIPFFSPLFAGTDVPVVQVIHHVHQDQFDTRFPARSRHWAGSWRERRHAGYTGHGPWWRCPRRPGRSCGTGCTSGARSSWFPTARSPCRT